MSSDWCTHTKKIAEQLWRIESAASVQAGEEEGRLGVEKLSLKLALCLIPFLMIFPCEGPNTMDLHALSLSEVDRYDVKRTWDVESVGKWVEIRLERIDEIVALLEKGCADVDFRWGRCGRAFKVRFRLRPGGWEVHDRGFKQTFFSRFGTSLEVDIKPGTRALYIPYDEIRAVKGDYSAFLQKVISKGWNEQSKIKWK